MQRAFAGPNFSRIELLSASTAIGNGGHLLLGVRIEPKPGWKTYWRAPGESGLPPTFNFTAHENSSLPQIEWPAPKRQMQAGLESYGYDGPVIFPFYVQPLDVAKPVRLEILVDYAVCLDICVPEQALLALTIASGAGSASQDRRALLAALGKVPRQQQDGGLHRITASGIIQEKQKFEYQVEAEADQGFETPDLFVDGAPDLMFSAPGISYSNGRRRAIFSLDVLALNPSRPIFGQTVTLTLVDGEFALEKQVKLAKRAGTE